MTRHVVLFLLSGKSICFQHHPCSWGLLSISSQCKYLLVKNLFPRSSSIRLHSNGIYHFDIMTGQALSPHVSHYDSTGDHQGIRRDCGRIKAPERDLNPLTIRVFSALLYMTAITAAVLFTQSLWAKWNDILNLCHKARVQNYSLDRMSGS